MEYTTPFHENHIQEKIPKHSSSKTASSSRNNHVEEGLICKTSHLKWVFLSNMFLVSVVLRYIFVPLNRYGLQTLYPNFLEKLCKKTLDQAGKSILSQFTIFHKIFENDSSFYETAPYGKSLISVFQEFFATFNQIFILAGRLGYHSMEFWDFHNI